MQRVLVLGSSLVFLMSLGCSPSSSEDDDDGKKGGTYTLQTFAEELNKYGCAQAICSGWESPSTCVTEDDWVALDEVQASVNAGRLKFDATAAGKCVDAFKKLDQASCWGANAVLDDAAIERNCVPVFKGLVAEGADCYDAAECAAGSCDFSDNACPGKCAAFRTAGQSCDGEGLLCADGLACSGEGVCAKRAEVGESCEDVECVEGLVCDVNGKCAAVAAPAAVGAECDETRPCADGLFCNRPDWSEPGQCAQRVAPGGTCAYSSECQGRQICVGAGFGMEGDLLGKCALPQDVGGPCAPTPEDAWFVESGCYGVLACDPATSKCVKAPKAGQPCIDFDCAEGAYCNDEDQCVAQKANGQPCEYDEECVSYECGEEGVCVPYSGDGAACGL